MSVVLAETMLFLDPKQGGRFIDATLGAGGLTQAILDHTAPDGKVLAIDQDEAALSSAKGTLESFGSRVLFVHSNFRAVRAIAIEHGFMDCDGILADIGICAVGTLTGAMAVAGRARELILPLLFLPLAIPIVAGGIAASVRDEPRYLAFLGLYDLVFVLLSWGAFEYVVAET